MYCSTFSLVSQIGGGYIGGLIPGNSELILRTQELKNRNLPSPNIKKKVYYKDTLYIDINF